MSGLLGRQLLFVTGKGGVGKTTVTAALATLAAERGKRVLVCETDPKGDLADFYECGPTSFVPVEVSPGVFAMSMDTEASLREYLKLNLRVPMVGRIGPVATAFDFVATAAPGVREILTVGKLCYEVRERRFDLVVVDASPTGNIVGQLAAPVGINELVRVGAIRSQTQWMLDILSDPARTGVVLVATPEEMPVREAVDLAGRLERDTGVALAGVVANRVLPELFSRTEEAAFDALATSARTRDLAAALGRGSRPGLVEVLEAARLALRIRRGGAAHLRVLREGIPAEVPLVFLPYLFGRSTGRRAVRQLAESLAEELGE